MAGAANRSPGRRPQADLKLAAAIGRFALGAFLGSGLWACLLLGSGRCSPGAFEDAIFAWLLQFRVFAVFCLGGGVLGLLSGDRFFRQLSKPPDMR